MAATTTSVGRGAEALLRPRSVAVLGASANRPGSGNFALANLLAARTAPDVHVVHPSADRVDGVPAVRSAADLPRGLDAALVSLPATAVLPVLSALEERGCAAAVVPSAAFSPADKADLARFARTSPMAVHGPNCMGLINVTDGCSLWFYDDTLTDQRRGPVALVSQSGSALFVTRATETAGFSRIVSTGDEIGLTAAEYLRWLAADPATGAVGLVLESVRDVPSFVDAVRELRRAGKPLVALKVGRTELGAAASRAHTGALTGKDAAYTALFERLDVPLVADYDELAAVLDCWSATDLPAPAGVRVAVATDSGGEAGLAADLAARLGVVLPAFGERTRTELADALPGAVVNNPLDAGASPGAGDDVYERTYRALAGDPDVDALLVVVEAHHGLSRGETDYSVELCRALRDLAASGPGKPVVAVSSSSIATTPQLREWLGDGVPLLRGISNGFAALRALAGNRRPVPEEPRRPARLPGPAEVAALRRRLVAAAGTADADLARSVLAAYGLPFVESVVVGDAAAAVAWAAGRYPVVVKVSSPDVAHRSEVGGVVTGVGSDAAVVAAVESIRRSVSAAVPAASVAGYEVQRQLPAGVEAVLGFAADPVFGATVTVGTGGTLVELQADVATSLAPVTADQARDLVARTRLGRLLGGYRNLVPATDLGPLATAVESLSWLAADLADVVREADLNPVVVEPGTGAPQAVDVLLVTAPEGVEP